MGPLSPGGSKPCFSGGRPQGNEDVPFAAKQGPNRSQKGSGGFHGTPWEPRGKAAPGESPAPGTSVSSFPGAGSPERRDRTVSETFDRIREPCQSGPELELRCRHGRRRLRGISRRMVLLERPIREAISCGDTPIRRPMTMISRSSLARWWWLMAGSSPLVGCYGDSILAKGLPWASLFFSWGTVP